jgi:hypothetical protein
LCFYPFQKSKIILFIDFAKASPLLVIDAVKLDAVYTDPAMLALS